MHHKDKIIIYQVMVRLFGNKKAAEIPFGTIEENGVGKFNDITDKALQEIKNLGCTHIYFTGIIEHATLTDYTFFDIKKDHPEVVKGRAGSPYAIKDYYDVDPDLAEQVPQRMKEFEALVQRAHQNELKVIIDFVPNHVARHYFSDAKPDGVLDFGEKDNNSKAFDPQNNYYYLPDEKFKAPENHNPLENESLGNYEELPAKASGNDVFIAQPSVNDWYETVKLNYGVDIKNGQNHFSPIPDTWLKMKEIILFWCSKRIDGFRCDMAEMVPVEFWKWLIPQCKDNYPELIFIAEIYNKDKYRKFISDAHFDYLYDKVGMYDTLRTVITSGKELQKIKDIYFELKDIDRHLLRFLENHDEQRIASHFFAGDAFKAIPAMVITATIGKGPVMLYFGQEAGEPAAGASGFSGNDGRTTIYDYWNVPEHQKWMNNGAFDGGRLSEDQIKLRGFYNSLLNICKSSDAIITGTFFDMPGDDNYFNYLRISENEALIIVNNFSDKEEEKKFQLPEQAVNFLNQTNFSLQKLRQILGTPTNFEIADNHLLINCKANNSYIIEIHKK